MKAPNSPASPRIYSPRERQNKSKREKVRQRLHQRWNWSHIDSVAKWGMAAVSLRRTRTMTKSPQKNRTFFRVGIQGKNYQVMRWIPNPPIAPTINLKIMHYCTLKSIRRSSMSPIYPNWALKHRNFIIFMEEGRSLWVSSDRMSHKRRVTLGGMLRIEPPACKNYRERSKSSVVNYQSYGYSQYPHRSMKSSRIESFRYTEHSLMTPTLSLLWGMLGR